MVLSKELSTEIFYHQKAKLGCLRYKEIRFLAYNLVVPSRSWCSCSVETSTVAPMVLMEISSGAKNRMFNVMDQVLSSVAKWDMNCSGMSTLAPAFE